MAQLGYALSTEEHGPTTCTQHAAQAEETGFDFMMVSDHYHPWVDAQGHSPFVWNVLGAIARETDEIPVGTGVTAPINRIHPAIIAQAAATTAVQMDGRFTLGLGTGENLNEHVLGHRWPPHHVRLGMLREAIEIIDLLWEGGMKNFNGEYYKVENARVYDLPEERIPKMIAASGERAAALAGEYGDALVNTSPDPDVVDRFETAGGDDAPQYGQVHVCYAESEDASVETAYEQWPNGVIGGELGQLLPTPTHFEQATSMVEPEDIREQIVCGNDVDEHISEIESFLENGYERVYVHQIGDNQSGFFDFYETEIMPRFAELPA